MISLLGLIICNARCINNNNFNLQFGPDDASLGGCARTWPYQRANRAMVMTSLQLKRSHHRLGFVGCLTGDDDQVTNTRRRAGARTTWNKYFTVETLWVIMVYADK